MKALATHFFDRQKLEAAARKYGPLVLLALMPGGSIIALVLWLGQRWHKEPPRAGLHPTRLPWEPTKLGAVRRFLEDI